MPFHFSSSQFPAPFRIPEIEKEFPAARISAKFLMVHGRMARRIQNPKITEMLKY